MNKNFAKMALVLAVILSLMATAAFASVPSKTTTDVTTVTTVTTSTGEEAAGIVVEVTEDTEEAKAEIAKLYEFVQSGTEPVVSYFPVEVQVELAGVIDADKAELNEFVSLNVSVDEKYTSGKVMVNYVFTTVYKPTQVVVPMVAVYTGEVDENGEPIVVWYTLEGIVEADGSLTVHFTQEVLQAMNKAQSVALAVLNEAA